MIKHLFIIILFVSGCSREAEKEVLLNASREAPLGWVYLTIYTDSTFEFKYTGMRSNDTKIYLGKVEVSYDTLFFNYADSIPKAGKTALFNDKSVSYLDGTYHEGLSISSSQLHAMGDSINLLINPSDFEICNKTFIDGHRFYYAKRNNDTIFLTTYDNTFKTPEGYFKGMKYSSLPDSIKAKIHSMPGWAYYIKPNSDWQLAFFEGKEGTSYPPNDSSRVGFIFKRK